MTHIDIPADLNSEDETGLVWTFHKPAGTIVHLRVLPGTIEQYRRLLSRVGG